MTDITSTDTPPAPPLEPARKARREPGVRREVGAFNAVAHLGLAFWALVTVGPLIWVILSSFKTNTEIFLGNPFALPQKLNIDSYATAWKDAHVGRYFI